MEGEEVSFRVRCTGSCINANIYLSVESGNPQLFALESARPIITENDCEACHELCVSKEGIREHCNNINTAGDNFHVVVYALYSYEKGFIEFENVTDVVEYGK